MLRESSAGLEYDRMPIIGGIDRSQVETMPWSNEMHPEFFDNATQKMHPQMLKTMRTMINKFLAYTGIPREHVKDILFKGSLAGYNYTPTSDIDLQIVLKYNYDKNPARDEKADPKGRQLERKYNTLRAQYNNMHGYTLGKEKYPVEFFVHTPKSNVPTGASARYSVKKNDWVPGYKPSNAPGLPKKSQITKYFQQYYGRLKKAYRKGYMHAMTSGMKYDAKRQGLIAAQNELKSLARVERNVALHSKGVSIQADVTSPSNLAFKALKRTKLVAYIETQLPKMQRNVNEESECTYQELVTFLNRFRENEEGV